MRRSASNACGFLLLTVSLPSWPQAGDPHEVQAAVEKLAESMASTRKQEVVLLLADSGLAPQEIERIAAEAISGYARCLVNALVSSNDPRSKTLLTLVAQATSKKEIDDAMDIANPSGDPALLDALLPVFKECTLTVNQELGLPLIDGPT